ncbi:MAG TPA: ATP-binding protein [Elusimicrobiales bacterium]|nr:ATP-binding protein [Elusimicrobiales bacterium]
MGPRKKKRIVFTGGPSGGKTSTIEVLQRHFGAKIAVVPEAASILYTGGFPRRPETAQNTQRAIYYIVRELEDLTERTSDASVIICDRGTLDGEAYWPSGEGTLLESVGSTPEQEFARYDAVVFMHTPKTLSFYQGSSTRIESHRQALELDKKLEKVWKNHPKLYLMDEHSDFIEKMNRSIEILAREAGI